MIYTVILGLILDLLEAYGWFWRYTKAGNFDHDPTYPLFIPVQSNLHYLAAVLPQLMHPLNREHELRPVIDSVSTEYDSH